MEAAEGASSSSSSSSSSSAAAAAAAAAAPVLGAAGGDVPPSQTLYVQNLTEKVKKAPLKKSLFVAFSPFGRVVDIVHCRSNALRGQAWVVFGDVACATAAMAKLQSFPLFDKPMVRPAARRGARYRLSRASLLTHSPTHLARTQRARAPRTPHPAPSASPLPRSARTPLRSWRASTSPA
jgi:hypothetical protein